MNSFLSTLAQVGLMAGQLTGGKVVAGVLHEKVKQVVGMTGLSLDGVFLNAVGKMVVPTGLVVVTSMYSKHWPVRVLGGMAQAALASAVFEASSDVANHVVGWVKPSQTR
jgi:hypothetical protein